MKRGLFITFEGMDGCGKTTQVQRLIARLEAAGRQVVESAEPGGTAIGSQIRQVLLDTANHALSPIAEILLYFASRAQNVDERIRPALAEGAVVVSDRFTDSTLVYQGYGRGLGPDTVMTLHRIACREVNPDITLLLDIDLETSLARAVTAKGGRADRMEEQRAEFYGVVRDAYLDLARREPDRVKRIDGRGSVEAVAERVWEAVRDRV